MIRTSGVWFVAVLALCGHPSGASAASVVFVDFGPVPTGWKSNLDMLMGSIGAAPMAPGELMALESIVLGELDRIYADFDVVFTTAMHPGMTNKIDFTKGVGTSLLVAGPSLPLGIADTDWLNRQFFPPPRTYQLAEIFPQEFGTIVDEFAGSTPATRMPMIPQLGVALGGTAAHEIGHTYGLKHWDAYGSPLIGPVEPSGVFPGEWVIHDTDGIQNGHVMATGETGLMEMGRESPRTLSRYSKAKLEIASDPSVTPEPLVSTPFLHTTEVAGSHAAMGMAQPLESTLLPISGLHVANVHGAGMGGSTPGGGALPDYYAINVTGAGLVTVEVISVGDYAPFVETTIRILDGMGTELYNADDLSYSFGSMGPHMVFSATMGIDSLPFSDGMEDDPLLLNMDLPAGVYFIEVAIDVDGVHAGPPMSTDLFYDLFVTSESRFTFAPPVPEPASLVLLAVPVAILAVRRRTRR